jgi:hypothetical protein
MKKLLSILAIASVINIAAQLPGQAEPKKSYIGPHIGFGLPLIGATGRFGISDNVSIRPRIGLPDLGADVTYDFGDTKSKFTPYIGAGLDIFTLISINAGFDYDINDSQVINGTFGYPTGIGFTWGFKF